MVEMDVVLRLPSGNDSCVFDVEVGVFGQLKIVDKLHSRFLRCSLTDW